MTDDEIRRVLDQCYRWFQYAKNAASNGDAQTAWSDANQGQHYINEVKRDLGKGQP